MNLNRQLNERNQREPSVLALLRSLVPTRALTHEEAHQVAELQANRLLEYFEITDAPIPDEIVSELPRLLVVREPGLPVSGSSHWSHGRWIIALNASEPPRRQRFTLMHEFKHVLDHQQRHLLRGDEPRPTSDSAERLADYFAACVLMPKRLVKRRWGEGPRDPEALAEHFQVSVPAMRFCLSHLGLSETARCSWNHAARKPRQYYRRSSLHFAAVHNPPLLGGGLS